CGCIPPTTTARCRRSATSALLRFPPPRGSKVNARYLVSHQVPSTMKQRLAHVSLPIALCFGVALQLASAEPPQRPNVVIILADDLGFSDIGCYGGEIRTPNIDSLAADGVRFAQFYNMARCCPTRASLLTGLYPHQAGIGAMNQDLGKPAYQ